MTTTGVDPDACSPEWLDAQDHGGDESSEFARQQTEPATSWSAQGVGVQEIPMADGHHVDVERLVAPGALRSAVLDLV